jgi:hypothetical protein
MSQVASGLYSRGDLAKSSLVMWVLAVPTSPKYTATVLPCSSLTAEKF